MSNLDVSYPIAYTISGSRGSWGSWGSKLYCCKSVSMYTAITFASFSSWSSPHTCLQKTFLYALIDLEVLLVRSGANTLRRRINCRIIVCMCRKCSLGVQAKKCVPLSPTSCRTRARRSGIFIRVCF